VLDRSTDNAQGQSSRHLTESKAGLVAADNTGAVLDFDHAPLKVIAIVALLDIQRDRRSSSGDSELIQQTQPERLIFTHLGHRCHPRERLVKEMRHRFGAEVAYDGWRLSLD